MLEYQQQIEPIIKKKLKTSQILLTISILISIGVTCIGFHSEPSYYLWAMYFVIIGALSLPNINKCKKDLLDFRKNMISYTEGKVLDVFPEREENGNWIIFLDVEGEKDIVEFVVPSKPSIQVESMIRIHHTNILKVPVKIEILK
jgi:hypothetical protein